MPKIPGCPAWSHFVVCKSNTSRVFLFAPNNMLVSGQLSISLYLQGTKCCTNHFWVCGGGVVYQGWVCIKDGRSSVRERLHDFESPCNCSPVKDSWGCQGFFMESMVLYPVARQRCKKNRPTHQTSFCWLKMWSIGVLRWTWYPYSIRHHGSEYLNFIATLCKQPVENED